MRPENKSLTELFDGNLFYIVPSYQRLYVWTCDDQWEPLWFDVRDIANGLLASSTGSDTAAATSETTDAHFLGAVVLKGSGYTPDLARALRVIDGQQRLTTLQILIAAAATALDDHVLTEAANSLRRLTTNASTPNPLKIQHQRHRLGHDYERFADVMQAAADRDRTRSIAGPMGDCYGFFVQAIDAWLHGARDELSAAGSALATTLASKLCVVAIYLDLREKEHAIFESLNARGEPLTEWDKIKNYLLYKADEDPRLRQEEFCERYLDGFDGPWWRDLVGRGVQRPRTDVFVDYWLEAQKATPVAVRRVFREFQRYVDDADDPLDDLMDQLRKDARYFRESEEVDPTAQTREALFHRRRLALGVGAIWPLLFRIRNLSVDQDERERCLATLESYLVRRRIAGYQARSYDRVTLELIGVLQVEGSLATNASDAIRQQLLGYREGTNLWPSDAETSKGVMERTLPQYAQLLVLTVVERNLITGRAARQDVPTTVEVEHLMPEGWQPSAWPLPEGMAREEAEQRRNDAIGTVGNLTLLNGKLNSSISNSAWAVKRSAIEEHDNLFLNRRLLSEAGSGEWTEEQIKERGQWMCGEIMKIWPRA